MERRLAAILSADVVGYSRLMGADEAGTLEALKALRTEIVDPKIAGHKGRVFKSTGDGVLAEFPSVVNAVSCAVEIQRVVEGRTAEQSTGRALRLRIGVNLGDVIIEEGDIFGDGVNVAARLESIAAPGGIAISSGVRDQIGNRLKLQLHDIGRQILKNIAEPIHVWTISGGQTEPCVEAPLTLPDRPSIAVLPFQNMSGDPEQEYFADGLSEDIITDLSNVHGLMVIARNSCFAFKGKPTDVRQIARQLGVKYVLEGSARRVGQKIRVNVQLIDAAGSGAHLFAERFDRDFVDTFSIQDEITKRVVEAVTGKIVRIGERRRPTSMEAYEEAYELCMRARSLRSDPSIHDEGIALLKKAITLDPNYCEAHWQLALAYAAGWITNVKPQEQSRRDSLAHAQLAIRLDPRDSGAHAALGFVLTYDRRWEVAEACFEEAIRLNPNDADTLAQISDFKVIVGKPQEAVDSALRALRLNPTAPNWYYWFLGQAQIAAGMYKNAVATLRREETYRTNSRRDLCVALVNLGNIAEAKEEAEFFLSTNPDWWISYWLENEGAALKNKCDVEFWADGYRKAGLPE